MKAKEYKGLRNNENYPYYFIHVNMDFDVSNLIDESGKPFTFVGYVEYKGEISSWKPFRARYIDYTGKDKEIIFTCPKCGSHNCERPNHRELADNYFFQGEFKCSNCCTGGFNYYSDCFSKGQQQLSLF